MEFIGRYIHVKANGSQPGKTQPIRGQRALHTYKQTWYLAFLIVTTQLRKCTSHVRACWSPLIGRFFLVESLQPAWVWCCQFGFYRSSFQNTDFNAQGNRIINQCNNVNKPVWSYKTSFFGLFWRWFYLEVACHVWGLKFIAVIKVWTRLSQGFREVNSIIKTYII